MGKPVNLQCRAVLFDMDGTLVDSTPIVELAWKLWAQRHNIPLEEVLCFSHGRPGGAVLERFLPGRDHSAEERELAEFEETHTDGITAVPGAADLLHQLQTLSHPWAIVTSAWRTLAEQRVRTAGLPLPQVIVPVDEIRYGKPDPEGFLKAASMLGVAPRDCVVFEDTRPGIDAGLSAGMQVVGLLTTFSASELQHHTVIRDFRDMKTRLQEESLNIELDV